MEFDFNEAVKRATGTTFDNAAKASNLIGNNIRRFNLVLGKKKTEELKIGISGICFAMNNFGIEKMPDMYRIGLIGIKRNFEELPQNVQILRLHNLNRELTAASDTSSADMPIHIRCRKIYKACKRFTAEKKDREFTAAAASVTELSFGKTDEAKIRAAREFALGK